MSFTQNLKQTATYWVPGSRDQYGKPSWSSPTQIPCRWEVKANQIFDKKGTELVTKNRVFTTMELDIDGFLFLGTSAVADPADQVGALEIQQLDSVPDLRSSKTLYTAYC